MPPPQDSPHPVLPGFRCDRSDREAVYQLERGDDRPQGGCRALRRPVEAGLTKALANEWAGQGVNVSAVAPGYIKTDTTRALRDDPDLSAQILGRIPAGRWCSPGDLAGAIVFLASRGADYVNGAVLPVDGGWLARWRR